MVMAARRNPDLAAIISRADVVVCDGQGVRWAFGKLHHKAVPLIPGIELAEELIKLASGKSWNVTLVGGKPGIWEDAKSNLESGYEGLRIVGGCDGFFTDEQEPMIFEKLGELNPQILFAGMGFPKQDILLNRYRDVFKGTIMIGVGGSLDVFAGKVKRAPVFFRKLRIEWLWRMVKEPERFKNLRDILKFCLLILAKHHSVVVKSSNKC
jgi:N-acetylglucosaminyldiphosphoundecaprenol N-acetyl-beta-D-mannosaminyltransferase